MEETQQMILEALKMRRSWCPLGQARNFGDLTVLLTAVLKVEAAGVSESFFPWHLSPISAGSAVLVRPFFRYTVQYS